MNPFRFGTHMWTTRVFKSLAAVAAVVTLAACSLDKQNTPPLAGPSELGLSLAVSATPDVITWDGQSVATIQTTALDAAGQPASGISLRLETYVDGEAQDYGQLSSKVLSTGADGRAVTTYRAPSAPPATQSNDILITVVVTPVGTNYAGAVPRQVQIRLARSGVIDAPTDGPVPSFFHSPTSPREHDDVFFDASASTGSIVSYEWAFGDGRTGTGRTARYAYGLAGTYSVVLTVTDHLGRRVSSAPRTVTVASAVDPTASFTTSPASPRAHIDVVTFNASGSKAVPGRTIVEYAIDFGDGSPMYVGSNPITHHVYTTPRTYTAVLRVMDDAGRYNVASQSISVTAP